ncbi:MAG: hypothetical protein QOE51_2520 [Actinoplanes sp.]|jgi:hypothetical protein|nr:hypothetical protein [Actinoplanes sp.]
MRVEGMRSLHRGDPDEVGGYLILGRLGSGGMGVVYLARDRHGALVAVKVVHAAMADDETFRERFRSEVARAQQVPPFCTAEVLDADPDHHPPFLVTEYVDGPSLHDEVSTRGPMTPANVHSVALGVASALTAIHGAEVIHRDLKPRNVLLAPGSPKVIDFGIARAFESVGQHTRTGQWVGTVEYMAPERFGDPALSLTPAADVFAWGVVVAYAASGRTPFDGGSPTATAARIIAHPPDLAGVPLALRPLVAAALAKNPEHRPAAADLMRELSGAAPVAGGNHHRRMPPPMPTRAPAHAAAPARTPAPNRAERSTKSLTSLALVLVGVLAVAGLTVGGLSIAGLNPLARSAKDDAAAAAPPPQQGKIVDGARRLASLPDAYQIRNGLSATCLTADGDRLDRSECGSSASQTWHWLEDGTLRTANGQCAGIAPERDAGRSKVAVASCTKERAQQWRAVGPLGTPAKRHLIALGEDECLEANEDSGVLIGKCTDTSSQEWDLVRR